MAITEQTDPQTAKGPSLPIQIAVLLGLTVAAVGLGWISGSYLGPAQEAVGEVAAEPETPAATSRDAEALLEPITTNLAAPAETWVRMEAAIVTDEALPQPLVEEIHQDLLAFLRTVKLHQVEGASGFQHLKADLEERAKIRSEGRVKQLLIRTLILE